GGDIFDEGSTVTVVIGVGGGTLSSATEFAVLGGANAAALGIHGRWEILQFKNADLIATDTYLLSGFLRGRRGTEWTMGLHATDERFVLLDRVRRADAPSGDLDRAMLYKPVT